MTDAELDPGAWLRSLDRPPGVLAVVRGAAEASWAAGAVLDLAAELGRSRRVLLLNLEGEGSALDRRLGAVGARGLTQALAGRASMAEVARTPPGRGFIHVPAGRRPASASVLLGSEPLARLVDKARAGGAVVVLYLPAERLPPAWRVRPEAVVLLGSPEPEPPALPSVPVGGPWRPPARAPVGAGVVVAQPHGPDGRWGSDRRRSRGVRRIGLVPVAAGLVLAVAVAVGVLRWAVSPAGEDDGASAPPTVAVAPGDAPAAAAPAGTDAPAATDAAPAPTEREAALDRPRRRGALAAAEAQRPRRLADRVRGLAESLAEGSPVEWLALLFLGGLLAGGLASLVARWTA